MAFAVILSMTNPEIVTVSYRLNRFTIDNATFLFILVFLSLCLPIAVFIKILCLESTSIHTVDTCGLPSGEIVASDAIFSPSRSFITLLSNNRFTKSLNQYMCINKFLNKFHRDKFPEIYYISRLLNNS